MSEDRREQIRAAASARGLTGPLRVGFRAGVRWAEENPQPRTITASEMDEMERTIAQRGGFRSMTLLDVAEMLGIKVTD